MGEGGGRKVISLHNSLELEVAAKTVTSIKLEEKQEKSISGIQVSFEQRWNIAVEINEGIEPVFSILSIYSDKAEMSMLLFHQKREMRSLAGETCMIICSCQKK